MPLSVFLLLLKQPKWAKDFYLQLSSSINSQKIL